MKGIRLDRLGEEIRQGVSDVLLNRAADPRLCRVVVTRVEVSSDLAHARVFVSTLGDEDSQEESLRVLSRARAFIRGEMGRRLRARRVPELDFRADPGIRYSIRLQQLLRELGFSDGGEALGQPNPDTGEE